jgi:eukaryotic-like serine/threonine-protein kinase
MRSLATRIATVTVAMVTLAVMLAVGSAWLIGQRVADSAVADSLLASQSIQRYLQETTAREIALTSDLLAADPHFTAYLVEAIRGGLDEAEGPDLRSILDQVDARRQEMGFDFAMMLDSDGQVLVRTDRPVGGRESRGEHPMVAAVMDDLTPEHGPWREGNRLYNAAVVPVTTAFEVVGFLVSGMAISNEVAADIKRVTSVDVVFMALQNQRPTLTASTLERRRSERLQSSLDPDLIARLVAGEAVERLDVNFDGESWVARVEPIEDTDGQVLGAVLTIDSLDARLAGHRAIQTALAAAGLAAILISLVLAVLVARRVASPVAALALAADQAAQGDYDQDIEVRGRDEVGMLARAFSRLLADLREQKEIAGYVTEVSRHMGESVSPEPAAPQSSPAPALPSGPAVLVALQWREDETRSMAESGRTLAAWLPRLQGIADDCQAALVGGEQGRLFLVFSQDRAGRLNHCLTQLFSHFMDLSSRPAMALASGELITVQVPLGKQRMTQIAGVPVRHCERLLGEAGSGRLLLSPAAYRELGEKLKAQGAEFELFSGQISQKKFYRLVNLPAADADSTQVMAAPDSKPAAPVSITTLHAGSVLGERYEILERVGAGAMGTVYRARDRKLDDIVALKLLQPHMVSDSENLERMKAEIRLARRITHPNVLRTHDLWEFDGVPVISMEYVRGITLSQLLERTGQLKLAAGLRVCSQVLQGLNAAHQAGVLHRDIKPANIILDQSGNARLMDFGIARQATRNDSQLTQPGMMVGTANYMAPEIVLGKTADQRSDLYSMGVMMSEVFTGRLPFSGASAIEVCMAHVQQDPEKPSVAWPQIPPELERIILTCMAREPKDRFPDAETLLARLIQVRRQSAAATDRH